MRNFFSELKRRNVYRVAALYLVTSWLILQIVDVFMDLLALPQWTGQLILVLITIGFPIALVLAWVFELTSEGVKIEATHESAQSPPLDTGRKLDFIIIGVLLVAVTYFAWNHDWSSQQGAPIKNDAISIAVLPFVNMSGDQDNEYFSDGISEEILNVLVRVDGMRVTSRTSSFAFKDKDVDLPTIARTLNVDHILEGSVRKDGNRVRVTAQLIDVKTDSHLWSDSYERSLEDIFTIQKDISSNIVRALEATLGSTSTEVIETRTRLTPSIEAYEAYLQGKYLLHNRGQVRAQGLNRAIDHFRQATELDPQFADAWAGLGTVHALLPNYSDASVSDISISAEPALQRAIELDPDNGMALAATGLLRMYQYRWTEADHFYSEALRLETDFVTTYLWYGLMLACAGKSEKAKEVLYTAVEKDPMSSIAAGWLSGVYRNLGDYQRGLDAAKKSIELGLAPSVSEFYLYHSRLGDEEAAQRALYDYASSFSVENDWVGMYLAAIDDPQAIPAFHNRIQEIQQQSDLFFLAWLYFELDDLDLLIEVIQQHAELNEMTSVLYRVWDPRFTELRNDPRFNQVMEHVGLMDYWRETGWPDLCGASEHRLVCD